MKSKTFTLLLLASLLASRAPLPAQSQLFIDTSFTAEQMVMDFFSSSCVTPSNITFNGGTSGMAFFEAANTDLGVDAGIVISTGSVASLANPASMFASGVNSFTGDPNLDGLTTAPTFDASLLEFDLTVNGDGNLDFQYVFGSEEYPEFVGTSFNDVFGFFVTDLNGGAASNIAMVPGSNSPVAINNVNSGSNSQYFVDYEAAGGQHVVFDGLTTPLLATFAATSATTYHVKIGVGDAGDAIFDSGVFIGIQSLCGDSLLTPPADALAAVDGSTVAFENLSRYATSWHWDFGDGTTSDERHPQPHTYALAGTYTVTLTTKNWCCEDTHTFTVVVGSPSGTVEAGGRPFELFPNPASDVVHLRPAAGRQLDYQLFDLMGKMVCGGVATGDKDLNISNLEPSAYLLVVRTEEEVFMEMVVVK